MTERISGGIALRFYFCSKLPSFGAFEFLTLFQALGGTVFRVGSREPTTDPTQLVNSEGDIMIAVVHHEFLSAHTPNVVTMGFFGDTNYVTFAKDISHPDTEKVDAVASSFLQFALLLYPHLGPAYGLIDEAGRNMPRIEDIRRGNLEQVLWANFFGQDYVKAYGREFLLTAPGWKTETLGDGGIVYVVSSSFINRWERMKAQQVRGYFRQKIPKVRIYRPYKDRFLR